MLIFGDFIVLPRTEEIVLLSVSWKEEVCGDLSYQLMSVLHFSDLCAFVFMEFVIVA